MWPHSIHTANTVLYMRQSKCTLTCQNQNEGSDEFTAWDIVVGDRDTGLDTVTLKLASANEFYFDLVETSSDADTGLVEYSLSRTDEYFDYESQRNYQVELMLTVSLVPVPMVMTMTTVLLVS